MPEPPPAPPPPAPPAEPEEPEEEAEEALGDLVEVDQNSSDLTAFPEVAPDVGVLLLYANKIKKVPPSIGQFKQLVNINCFNNQIGLSLPPEVGTLSRLREVNFAANKLAMLRDVHFASWANVKVLNLNDNNLSAIGSLAPLVRLEELRLFANQLSALPALPTSAPKLTVYEIHKNRITTEGAPDGYFAATPNLEGLQIWSNLLTALPSSITSCAKLARLQAQQNPELRALPDGPWPASLETLFVQETTISALPAALLTCPLKRVNISKLKVPEADAAKMKQTVLAKPGGMYWGADGVLQKS